MSDPKPSPLFFNSARGSRQSPFGRPGSVRASPTARPSPSAQRPSTPNSSPLKPQALSPGPPWLKTNAADPPSSPVLRSPSREPLSPSLRSPSREPTSSPSKPLSPGPQLLSPARDRTPSTNTVRPLSTASLAARFDGARDRSHTPPLVARAATPVDNLEKPVAAESVANKPATAQPTQTLTKSPAVQSPALHPTPLQPPRPPMIRQTTSDALSRLPPPLLHSMRESFSVMDRDDDGHVTPADVADMLSQLGLSATPAALAPFFTGAPSINLATYLNTLSDLLAALSRPNELTAAFEAFDDADDGQIDLAELKDALLHTAPEPGERRLTEREIDMVVDGFSGRRAFGKPGKGLGRGEVFRYQEFMASLGGGTEAPPS